MRWSGAGRLRVCIANKGGPQIPIQKDHLEQTKCGHAPRPDDVRGTIHAEERGHTTRARPVHGIRPETSSSEARTAAVQRGWELSAVMAMTREADDGRGSSQSADFSPRHHELKRQTAAIQHGLVLSAADVESILSICFLGQTRVCRVDPVRVLHLYKYF
ncbi:hypothetical protein F2Q70_00002386 [Brassica cretica]|uniref:Uncharacterized protein n=1 Tax=Brassica cretica TaxID=69181 RepID=A0A8S9IYM8_BRACR|nr:hypothetical protein F2Q70_00002386 [Brassica cretica]